MSEDTNPTSQPVDKLKAAAEKLRLCLSMVDFFSNKSTSSDAMQLIVTRIYPMVLRIDNSNNHSRPHFHLEYKREHTASYAIDNFELLAGSMPRKYREELLEWAKENQALLFEKWKEAHPGSPIYVIDLQGN